MSSFQDLTTVSYRFHNRIKKACLPLFECLNLNNFWHYKITASGYYSVLESNIEWAEYLAGAKFHLYYPYCRHPRYFQNGVSVTKVEDKRLQPFLTVGKERFSLYDSIQLIAKTEDGIEGFGFTAASSQESHISLLLNELPLLRLFVKKFKEEHQLLLSTLEDNQIDLVKLIGPAFYEKSSSDALTFAVRQAFLQKMGIQNEVSLTPREKEIARLLPKGLSADQIGREIFLSKRTVEHHVERMKEKLQCGSKAELIQKVRELEYFGCLMDEG